MKAQTGYIYHIKDEFFDLVNDESLMSNHEKGRARPTYFTIKDGNILWFIPLSSKIEKYKRIVSKKIKRYGRCDTILIRKILGAESAILLQNAFPTIEKYIDHVHLNSNGIPAKVVESIEKEIIKKFVFLIKLKRKGTNLFFTDIDKIKRIMLNELK